MKVDPVTPKSVTPEPPCTEKQCSNLDLGQESHHIPQDENLTYVPSRFSDLGCGPDLPKFRRTHAAGAVQGMSFHEESDPSTPYKIVGV
ncbi:unnamed protein product [Sphenostylis stenocarpa]|uniref:Uncharacterized protein n=1 Tax=Sphenostylis stenocarpa TaxID=92480 RepID=A0AA86W1G3_9FABA|nr:unnamed protein product [Sphenostylis stenocarpa]